MGLISRAALHRGPAQNRIKRGDETKCLQTPRTGWTFPYSNVVILVYIFHTEILAFFEVQFTSWQLQVSATEQEKLHASGASPKVLVVSEKYFVASYKEMGCSLHEMLQYRPFPFDYWGPTAFQYFLSHSFHPVDSRFPLLFLWTMVLTWVLKNFFHSHCKEKKADSSLTKHTK